MSYNLISSTIIKCILSLTPIISPCIGMEIQSNKDRNQEEITVKKALSLEEIKEFSAIDRLDSYLESFNEPSNPFGVYIRSAA